MFDFLRLILFFTLKLGSLADSRPNTVIEDTLMRLLRTTIDLKKKLDTSLRTTTALTLSHFNAYDSMTQTSAGQNKPKQEHLRMIFYDNYKITNDLIKDGCGQARCTLTGRSGKLKLTHLVPASAKLGIRQMLKLRDEDIWSFRNVLLLSVNIELAFDRLRLSFSPTLRRNSYFMKIWDNDVKQELIWDNATETLDGRGDHKIGYYEGKELELEMHAGKLEPFKRCLSYHEFMCFAKSERPLTDAPEDFSSDIGDMWSQMRGDLLVMRKSLEKNISEETEDE